MHWREVSEQMSYGRMLPALCVKLGRPHCFLIAKANKREEVLDAIDSCPEQHLRDLLDAHALIDHRLITTPFCER